MPITWNVVNRTERPDAAVADAVRARLETLAPLVAGFPDEALHLQAILTTSGDERVAATLNLRVPSDVLGVTREGADPGAAVEAATRALGKRLQALRARYDRDEHFKRHDPATSVRGASATRTSSGGPASAFAEAPLPHGAYPQTLSDLVGQVLRDEYDRLLGFVDRQLREYLEAGTVPRDVVEGADIVHRVAETILHDPTLKPDTMDVHTWSASLAFQETRTAVREYLERHERPIPPDLEADPEVAPVRPEEPEAVTLNLADGDGTASPVGLVEEDVVGGLRKMIRQWPKIEREIFEMHFLEGFSVDDIARTLDSPKADVAQRLGRIRARFRTRLTAAAARGAGEARERSAATERSAHETGSRAQLDEGRRAARDAVATRTRSEFDALLIAMRRLESSLAAAAPHRERAWRVRVQDDFRAVHEALASHVRSARADDGLFAEIELARPELAPRVGELVAAQEELVHAAEELERAVDTNGATPDVERIRRQAADLLFAIRRQHARETDLIYETFWTDIGSAD